MVTFFFIIFFLPRLWAIKLQGNLTKIIREEICQAQEIIQHKNIKQRHQIIGSILEIKRIYWKNTKTKIKRLMSWNSEHLQKVSFVYHCGRYNTLSVIIHERVFPLLHEDKIITNVDENAKILNSFFSNVGKHLKIPEFKDFDFSAECIFHPTLKAIMKFRNHPSVSAIKNTFNP